MTTPLDGSTTSPAARDLTGTLLPASVERRTIIQFAVASRSRLPELSHRKGLGHERQTSHVIWVGVGHDHMIDALNPQLKQSRPQKALAEIPAGIMEVAAA